MEPNYTQMDLRNCFSTDVGKRVLGWMLLEAGFFDSDLKTTDELAVENYVKNILKQMGVYDSPEKMGQVIDGLMNVRIEV